MTISWRKEGSLALFYIAITYYNGLLMVCPWQVLGGVKDVSLFYFLTYKLYLRWTDFSSGNYFDALDS